MKFTRTLFILMSMCALFSISSSSAYASSEHGHNETEAKGPHGGTLLRDGDVSVEITIFESGVPPEMRVYAYRNNEIVQPDTVKLEVTLHRLGNVNDSLSFIPEENYLVSNEVITEPHS